MTGSVLDRFVATRLVVASESEGEGVRVELVHEALIRHWGQLREWLSASREGRRTLQALRNASREWDGRGRPRGLLWRGEVLDEYRVWRRRSGARLTELEQRFAQSSLVEEARSQRVRRMSIGGALLALAVFGVFMFVQYREAELQRVEAVAAMDLAQKKEAQALSGQIQAIAGVLENEGRVQKAAALWRAATTVEASEHFEPGVMMASRFGLVRRTPGGFARVLDGHQDSVLTLQFSPDGSSIATGSADNTVRIWNLSTGGMTAALRVSGRDIGRRGFDIDPEVLQYAPNGASLIVTAPWAHVVHVWDVASAVVTKTIRQTGKYPFSVFSASYSPSGNVLAVGESDGTTQLVDPVSGRLKHILTGQRGWIRDVVFSPDGEMLASVSEDRTVWLWDVASGDPISELTTAIGSASDIVFNNDGSWFATVHEDGPIDQTSRIVRLWETKTGRTKDLVLDQSSPVTVFAFSPNGKFLAVGSFEQTLQLWEVASGRLVHSLTTDQNHVAAFAFSADSKWLATASRNDDFDEWNEKDGHAVLVWSLESGQLSHTFKGHSDHVTALAFSPDGHTLASGSNDHSVRLWDMNAAQPTHSLQGSPRLVTFSPDARWLATAADDEPIRLIQVDTGRVAHVFSGYEGDIHSLVFSADGAFLAAGLDDAYVRVWDVESGQLKHSLNGVQGDVRALAFSPNGVWLAASQDKHITGLWQLRSGQLVHSLDEVQSAGGLDAVYDPRVSSGLNTYAFSPDSTVLATGFGDSVRLWDVKSGALKHVLDGHISLVASVVFSPDGKHVATVSRDDTARLWDVESGDTLHTLEGHEASVTNVEFTSDGKRVATAGYDGVVRFWSPESGQTIQMLTEHQGEITTFGFSSDGQSFATGSADGTVRIWDTATGQSVHVFSSPRNTPVKTLSFEPDSERIAFANRYSLTRRPVGYHQISERDIVSVTGELTNLRVCRETLKVIAINPFPPAETVWAEEVLNEDEVAERCAL